jgi:hypothetical protein
VKIKILISLFLLGTMVVAWAAEPAQPGEAIDLDHNWYAGIALGSLRYAQSNLSDYRMTDHRVVIGKQLNAHFAAEIHLGNSATDTQNVTGVPVTLQVDNYMAGFLKASFNLVNPASYVDRVRLYGLFGASRVKTTSDDTLVSRSGVQTSAALGIGIEAIADNLALQLGYTRYVNGSANSHDYSLDSLYLGVVYEFAR